MLQTPFFTGRTAGETTPLLPQTHQHVTSNASKRPKKQKEAEKVAAGYRDGLYAQSMQALAPSFAESRVSPALKSGPLDVHLARRKEAAVALSMTFLSNFFNEGRNYAIPLMGSYVGLIMVTSLPLVMTYVNSEAVAANSRWAAKCALEWNKPLAAMLAKSAAVLPETADRSIIPNKVVQMQRIQKEHCATLAQLTAPVATLVVAGASLFAAGGNFAFPLVCAFIAQWALEDLAIKPVRTKLADRVAQSRVDVNNHLLEMPDALHQGVEAWEAFSIQHEVLQNAQANAEKWSERANILTGVAGLGMMIGLYTCMGWLAPVTWDERRRTTIATAATAGNRLSYILQPLCKQRSIWATNVAHSDALVEEVREKFMSEVSWKALTIQGHGQTPQAFVEALHNKTPSTWKVDGNAEEGQYLCEKLALFGEATDTPMDFKINADSPSSITIRVNLHDSPVAAR